ncbi:MAG: hypothetical protein WA771_12295 [Chthoniobacterales bacterium]
MLRLESIDGLSLRITATTVRLRANGRGTYQSGMPKTDYVAFASAWLEADNRVFRLANGMASIHGEGINLVTAAFEEMSPEECAPPHPASVSRNFAENRKNAQSFRADA